MKRTLLLFLLLLAVACLLIGCGETPAVTTPPQAASTTLPPATEATVAYASVPSLISDLNIISVKKDSYSELDGVDLSKLPPEAAALYRKLLEDTVTYEVLYRVGSCRVVAYVSLPADYETHTYPLLIYNRGGNGNYSSNTPAQVGMYTAMTDCIVIASNYRGTSPGTGNDEFGGADVDDVVFWIDMVESLGFVDRERVFMLGESRGGMQTCLALQRDTKGTVKAAACIGGAYDIANSWRVREDMREMLERRIGGTPDTCPEEYARRSAVTFADEIHTPLLIVHSTEDPRSPYSDAVAFTDALKAAGKSYTFRIREDGQHGITSQDELSEILAWLYENGK